MRLCLCKKSRCSCFVSDEVLSSLFFIIFCSISVHADGERRGPLMTRRYLKTRLAETLSDATLPIRRSPSAFAVGTRRKVVVSRSALSAVDAAESLHGSLGRSRWNRRPSASFFFDTSEHADGARRGPVCRSEGT